MQISEIAWIYSLNFDLQTEVPVIMGANRGAKGPEALPIARSK